MPIPVVGDLEKDKLPGAERIDGLTNVSKEAEARTNLLHTASVNVAMSAQKKLLHMVRMLKTWLIS